MLFGIGLIVGTLSVQYGHSTWIHGQKKARQLRRA